MIATAPDTAAPAQLQARRTPGAPVLAPRHEQHINGSILHTAALVCVDAAPHTVPRSAPLPPVIPHLRPKARTPHHTPGKPSPAGPRPTFPNIPGHASTHFAPRSALRLPLLKRSKRIPEGHPA